MILTPEKLQINVLSIETSSAACSVTLQINNHVFNKHVFHKHVVLENTHSKHLLQFIDELFIESGLEKQQLDLIAVGSGPGSFTGLRLGLGVAQGLAYGLGIRLICVPSLGAIAHQFDHDNLLVAVDARMGEVYWQCFHRTADKNYVELTQAQLSKPNNVSLPKISGHWQGVGSGWDVYYADLQTHLKDTSNWTADVLPHAATVAMLAVSRMNAGQENPMDSPIPMYVRNKVVG